MFKRENQCKIPQVVGAIDGLMFSLNLLFLKASMFIIGQSRDVSSVRQLSWDNLQFFDIATGFMIQWTYCTISGWKQR